MTREAVPTDVSDVPALARLAHEVAESGTRRLLTEHGAPLAVVSPVVPRKRRTPRPKPLSRDNPIWEIVGTVTEDVGSDVSENKHKYLAEAYAAETERDAGQRQRAPSSAIRPRSLPSPLPATGTMPRLRRYSAE